MADETRIAPKAAAPTAPAKSPDLAITQRSGAEAGAKAQTEVVPAPVPQEGLRLQMESALPLWMLIAISAMMLLALRRSYVRTTRKTSLSKRILLVFVRVSAVLVLMLSLARPVLVKNHELKEKGLCVVAVDSSSSMEIRDGTGGKTRWDVASSIVTANSRELNKLQDGFDLQRYAFDAAPKRIQKLPGEQAGQSTGITPAGTSTDLAALLDMIATESSGISTAGALIISDGRHNTSKDVIPSAVTLQRAGVPVYCVGIGWDAAPAHYRDVRVKDVVVPEKAFIGSRMVIRVEIESTLPNSAVTPVTIEVGGKKIHEMNIMLKPGTNVIAAPVEASYFPTALGAHRVVATAGTIQGETDTDNNTRNAFFRVYRSKLGIWYVEGTVRKEFGAIRSALETAPNVKFKALNAFTSRTLSDKELLPTSVEDQSQLRLIIIGDLPAERFDENGLAALAKWVEEGGAVLMIGGLSNFGAGKWHHTPLDKVFPVEMTLADSVSGGPLRISVADGQAQHPILAIGDFPQHSTEIWHALPPLPGVNNIKGLKPAAQVLLQADSKPLLVVQEYGKGRSAVFTADMTWQWILKAGQGDAHKRFWRNLATWLTRSDYRDTDKAVFTDAERLHFETGQEAVFNTFVHATEKAGPAIKDARVVLSLVKMQGNAELPVFSEDAGRGPGEFRKAISLAAAGNYRFKAAAIGADNKVIDSDNVDIQVTAPNLEHDNPRANLKLLRRIADMTGGAYFDADKAGEAFNTLLKRQAGYSKSVSTTTDLWNHPAVMVLFMLLLTIEWSLRKRWGLI